MTNVEYWLKQRWEKWKKVPFDLVALRSWMQIITTMQMWGMEEESYMEGCSSAPAPPLLASDSAAWKHKTLLTTTFFKLINIILKRHSLSCNVITSMTNSSNVWVLSLKGKMNYTIEHELICHIVSCSPVQCDTNPVPHFQPLVSVLPTHVFVVLLSVALLSLLSLKL